MATTLKELREQIGNQAKAGPRISRFKDLHEKQKKDQDFYNLNFELKVHEEFQKIKLPSARHLVDTFVSHLPLSNPVVSVIPFKPTNPYQAKATSQMEFYDALAHHSMEQTDNLMIDAGKDIGLRGETFIKLQVDVDALGVTGEEEADDARRMERMPVKLTCPDPMTCFPHADHADTHPADMIQIYPVLAEQVRRVWPDWKSNVGNSVPVKFVEYWSPKSKCFLAHDVPVTDGFEDNPFHFVPYSHVYSGLGVRDGDNSPENKAVGLIRFLHDVLKGECRQHAYLDKANAFASMPIIELPGRQEDYEEGGKKLVPRPGMIVFRGEGEEAGRVSWAAPNLPAGILESLIVYDRLLGKAQAAVLRGEVPRGIEAGYPMSLMIGQARLMFGIPLMNLQVVLARALEMVRLLIRDVIKEPLYAWGQNKAVTLKPEDCEGAYRVRVDFEASTAEGMMNEALGLQKLRQGGSISSRTEMELNPLIKNPTKELHRKKAESLFEHPTLQRMTAVKAVEALYGAKEALAVEQAMMEGEEGAVRKAKSTGIPPGGRPESELPDSIIEQAVLSRRGKALRGNE